MFETNTLPEIRRSKLPNQYAPDASYEERLGYEEMTIESSAYLHNDSMKDYGDNASHICETTVCRWFNEYFPWYGLSPVQFDYCDKCAELSMSLDEAKQSLQHLLDNSVIDMNAIGRKMKIVALF